MPGTHDEGVERETHAQLCQSAAAHAAAHRCKPRHRARDRDPLFLRRLARHHLLAPSISRAMPVGRWAGGSYPSRSGRPRGYLARDCRDPAAARRRRAACSRQQRGDLTEGQRWLSARLRGHRPRDLEPCVPRQLLRADHAGARVHPFAGAAYATSKAALAALTREMASDFGRVGVRVNSIAPGEIDTSILSPGTEKIVEQQIPMHRLGTPDEVAKIIYVLCTETSSYVNGAEIHINGGQHV